MRLRLASLLLLAPLWGSDRALAAPPASPGAKAEAARAEPERHRKKNRQAVRKQRGKASYYSRKFAGKKMADGDPMNPNANIAASKTLPLGTKAEVKNLETGKRTTVEIKDRGPYVKGRIIDLSPKAAEKLDMKKDGVAPVEVTPIEVPKAGDKEAPAEGKGGQ